MQNRLIINLSNLKCHTLYDVTKVTNKIKDTKKARKKYTCFCVNVLVLRFTKTVKTVFAYCKDTAKFDRYKKKREKFYETNIQTPVRTSRHCLACARRVSSPPSIPKSCFSIFPFKRVCACFSFPLFFNRSNPILSYFSFTSLFLIEVTTISFSFFFS